MKSKIDEIIEKFINKFFIKTISKDNIKVPPETIYSKEELQEQTDMVIFLKQSLDTLLDEERQRIYAYIEERLLGVDDELLKDLSSIIFNKTNTD